VNEKYVALTIHLALNGTLVIVTPEKERIRGEKKEKSGFVKVKK
jgi:hypothetical protein